MIHHPLIQILGELGLEVVEGYLDRIHGFCSVRARRAVRAALYAEVYESFMASTFRYICDRSPNLLSGIIELLKLMFWPVVGVVVMKLNEHVLGSL